MYNKMLLTLVCFLAIISISFSGVEAFNPVHQFDLTNGLIAYYPFNGNANDESGNINDGLVYNAVLAADRYGELDSAYSFDGDGDYIEVQHSDDFNFQDEISISFWMKRNEDQSLHYPQQYKSFVLRKPGIPTRNFISVQLYDAGNMRWNKGETGTCIGIEGAFEGECNDVIGEASVVPLQIWTHYVFTIDPEGNTQLYENGTLVDEGFFAPPLPTTSDPLRIGMENNANYSYNGLLDEIAIYKRVLTYEEIQELKGCNGAITIHPNANAGIDQTVDEASTVTLNGSNSSDPDNGIASYEWTQTSGPTITLSDNTEAQPTFTAPDVDINGSTLSFQLKVTDNGGLKSIDKCTVTVEDADIHPTCTSQPSKPQLLTPADNGINVNLFPTLTSNSFQDPFGCSTHRKTRWQISDQNDFSGLTLNANTINKNLTSYQVDRLVLEPNTTYYWRVKYWGTNGNKSEWSDVFSFTTQADSSDINNNGIPDNQEVDDDEDLNEDGTSDNNQTNELKSIKTTKGNSKICIYPQDSQITSAEGLDDELVFDPDNEPSQFPLGLIAYRLEVPYQGYRARVRIHLSEPASNNAKWVRFDEMTGWEDYSEHVLFNYARDEVICELKDGGYGDSDHSANGVIVDPSGLGIYDDAVTTIGTNSKGGGCFISTLLSNNEIRR